MRVLFLLTNPVQSPGERYRILQYLSRLEHLGIKPRVDTLLDRDLYARLQVGGNRASLAATVGAAAVRRMVALRKSTDVDLVVMYRQPVGLWPGSVETLLERSKVPFLFDFDDAIFLAPPEPVSRVSGYLRPPRRVADIVHRAALTTVGNRYLASFARQHSARVELLPTCVDTDAYVPAQRASRSRPVVGWIGSRSTAQYLRELDEVWSQLDRDTYVLRVIGGSYQQVAADVEVHPWALATETSDVAGFDIGVMPLPDDPWTRGKCGLKILQYMAAGVPTVASRVGVNNEMIEDGVNGFLAATPEEWAHKLQQLLTDERLRARLAEAARKTVVESYSLEVWAPRFADMMKRAAA